MKNKIKIFALYHDNKPIFKNDLITPLLTGACSKDIEFDGYKDNTGDNISSKNRLWAELTGQYWVLKNYIPQNPNLEYVGFCHYRRFFDILNKKKQKAYKKIYWENFSKKFDKNNNAEKIYERINDYDIIMPHLQTNKEGTIYEQYCTAHPKEAIDKLIEIVKRDYPEYVDTMNETLFGKKSYYCLNFIIKKELFEEYFNWIYDLLTKLDSEDNLLEYYEKNPNYNYIKIPAYLAERFINVWINHKIKTSGIKILEANTFLLFGFGCKKINFFIGNIIFADKIRVTLFNLIKFSFKRRVDKNLKP